MTASLYLSLSGERAVAVEGLRPLWEACKGGWNFQEAFLQRGGEERLGLPPAALPGPLPQRGPGNTPSPPNLCPTIWGLSAKKRKGPLRLLAQ